MAAAPMAGRWLSSTTRMSRSRMSASSCGTSGSKPKAPLTYRVRCASPMQDSMIIRSANSTPSTTPRAADGCRGIWDGAEQGGAGLGEPERAAFGSGVRDEHRRRVHLVWFGLERGADQRGDRDVAAAVAEPFAPSARASPPLMTPLISHRPARTSTRCRALARWIGDSQGVGHHVRGSHDEQRPAAGFGTQRVGRCGGVAGSDETGIPSRQAQSRGGGGQQRAEHAQRRPHRRQLLRWDAEPVQRSRRASGRTRRCWPSAPCRRPGWGRWPVRR